MQWWEIIKEAAGFSLFILGIGVFFSFILPL